MKLQTMLQNVLLLPLLAAGVLSGAAFAQPYPAKPVRWVIPFPPGGGTDLISRTITQKLAELWGVQVIADNRPGAGGTIGLDAAAKAPADGYTIVLGQASNVAVAPGLFPKLPYDPVKDLAPVTQVIAAPLVIVSHPSFPAKSARELIAFARSRPGEVTYGSPGNGTIGHLSLEMLKAEAHINMLHVPYSGAARALSALLGGEIAIYASSTPPALPQIKARKLKALGVTGAKRIDALPEVPTVAESGIRDFEAVNWYGVFVPANTPKDLVARLHADIVKVLGQPEVRKRFEGEGGDIVANTPQEFAALIRAETPKWSRVIKAAGVKVD
ncbi:MAG: Bug family tripartite tricarboxylate transporter substrate binding protein [Burkholderiales bacterium]